MDERLADLMDYVAALQAEYDHPRTPVQFARAARIRLIPSDTDSANAGPPSVITYNARWGLSYRRFSLWHEIAHILMGRHGIDADFDDLVTEASSEQLREQVANLVAGQLMVPRSVVTRAFERYGHTPAAILEMQELSGMSEAVCLRRFVFSDLETSRAAAVFVGPQVVDVSSNNYRIPFRRYDRVPEPALTVQHASLKTVRKTRLLAVWEG